MLHGKRGRVPLLGPVAGLVQLHGSSSVDVTRPERVKKTVAISGRVYAQKGPKPRREWAVGVGSAYPEHVQLLEGIEAGLLGPGPFVWYDELAQVTNLLTPDESHLTSATWSGGSPGGAGVGADGTQFLVSRMGAGLQTVELVNPVAVPGGYPVTVSAYVSAHPGVTATLTVREYDAAGTLLDTHTQAVAGGAAGQRATVTFTAAAQTRSVRVSVVNPLMVAHPAVTLTSKALPWGTGLGCRTAVVEYGGHTVSKALDGPTGRRMGYSITVHELD